MKKSKFWNFELVHIFTVTRHQGTLADGGESYDIQHNDTQHNDIQHNDIQHNDIQHNDIKHNDTQHNDNKKSCLCWVSFMLSVANKPVMLNVIMLSVAHTLSYLAPFVSCEENEVLWILSQKFQEF
jgi:hypothetical protein